MKQDFYGAPHICCFTYQPPPPTPCPKVFGVLLIAPHLSLLVSPPVWGLCNPLPIPFVFACQPTCLGYMQLLTTPIFCSLTLRHREGGGGQVLLTVHSNAFVLCLSAHLFGVYANPSPPPKFLLIMPLGVRSFERCNPTIFITRYYCFTFYQTRQWLSREALSWVLKPLPFFFVNKRTKQPGLLF